MKNFRFHAPVEVRYADLDTMRHVNNAVYLTYIEQVRSYYLEEACQWDWKKWGMVLAKTDIDYRRQIQFHNKPDVWIRTSQLGNSSITQDVIITEQGDPEMVFAKARIILVHVDYKTGRPQPIPQEVRERLTRYEEVEISA
jgi:acyl-CoA thioester hydrolase